MQVGDVDREPVGFVVGIVEAFRRSVLEDTSCNSVSVVRVSGVISASVSVSCRVPGAWQPPMFRRTLGAA